MKNLDPIHENVQAEDDSAKDTNPIEQTGTELAGTTNVSNPLTSTPVNSNENETNDKNNSPLPNTDTPAPATPAPYQTMATNDIYPTALTAAERDEKKLSNYTTMGTPFSIYLVSLLTIIASLHGLFTIIKIYFFGSVFTGSFLGGTDSLLGSWSWLVLVITLTQYSAMLYAGYKIWKGNLGALGFVTGLSFTSLYGLMIILPNFFQNISIYSFDTSAIYILYLAFYLALSVAWIKDRRYFY